MTTTVCENQPIFRVIKNYKENHSDISFNELKEELAKFAHFGIKEDENLALLYTDKPDPNNTIEMSTKSCVINKTNLNIIVTQFNNMIYNDETLQYINATKWDNVSFYKCYEGTMIIVFYECGKWYISTRRCLDANSSVWIKGSSYGDMFMEAINRKFELDSLDKNYCYHFVLLHYKNKNIVLYDEMNNNYTNIVHVMTTDKYTLNEVEYDIKASIIKPIKLQMNDINHVMQELLKISNFDKERQTISTEGFVVKIKDNNSITFLKLQTPEYQRVSNNKPNNSNMAQMFLEMYQRDSLRDFVHYYTRYGKDIVYRINMSMHTITQEVWNIYHATRNHKTPVLYNILPGSYKTILYELHKIFINRKSKELCNLKSNTCNQDDLNNDIINNDDIDNDNINIDKFYLSKAVSVHDVYNYLKKLQFYQLRQIYFDRELILDKLLCCQPDNKTIINKNCENDEDNENIEYLDENTQKYLLQFFINCPDTALQIKLMKQ